MDQGKEINKSTPIKHPEIKNCSSAYIHEIEPTAVFPVFFMHLDSNEVKAEIEADELASFSQWLLALKGNTIRRIDKVTRAIGGQVEYSTDNFIFVDHYLEHLLNCKDTPDNRRKQASSWSYAHEEFRSMRKRREDIDNLLSKEDPLILEMLRKPLYYTEPEIRQEEERLKAEQETQRKFIDFLTSTKDITDRQEFLEKLNEDLPEFSQLLEEFKNSLLRAKPGTDPLDTFLDKSADPARSFPINAGYEFVKENVEKQLSLEPGVAKSNSVFNDPVKSVTKFTSEDLEDVLVCLVSKSSPVPVDKANEIINAVISKRSEMIDNMDPWLERLEQHRQLMKGLLSKHSISEDLVERLVKSVEFVSDHPAFGKKTIRQSTVFEAAFNALVFAKKGKLDLNSPAFESFFKEVFPHEVSQKAIDVIREW